MTEVCNGCGVTDDTVSECEHDHALCVECVAEGKCRYCATEGMTRRWAA